MRTEHKLMVLGAVGLTSGLLLKGLGNMYKALYVDNNRELFEQYYNFTDANNDGFEAPGEVVPLVENPPTVSEVAGITSLDTLWSRAEWGDAEWGVWFEDYLGVGVAWGSLGFIVVGAVAALVQSRRRS